VNRNAVDVEPFFGVLVSYYRGYLPHPSADAVSPLRFDARLRRILEKKEFSRRPSLKLPYGRFHLHVLFWGRLDTIPPPPPPPFPSPCSHRRMCPSDSTLFSFPPQPIVSSVFPQLCPTPLHCLIVLYLFDMSCTSFPRSQRAQV